MQSYSRDGCLTHYHRSLSRSPLLSSITQYLTHQEQVRPSRQDDISHSPPPILILLDVHFHCNETFPAHLHALLDSKDIVFRFVIKLHSFCLLGQIFHSVFRLWLLRFQSKIASQSTTSAASARIFHPLCDHPCMDIMNCRFSCSLRQ